MFVPIKHLYPLDENKLLLIRSAIKTTCERHLIDLEASEMLRTVYPDRFKVVQYEHLFSEPVSRGVKDLYEFAGMNYGSEQQLQRLLDKQSEFNPFKYRTNVPWRVIEMFDLECSEVHST